METRTYIDLLLRKYRKVPSFPFADWSHDPVSFYAVINLWDDLFTTAAGQAAFHFLGLPTVAMDKTGYVYDVQTRDLTRRFQVAMAEDEGGEFEVEWIEGRTGAFPDRTFLGFYMDLDAERLVAAFDMIRDWVRASVATEQDAMHLRAAFVARHHLLFSYPVPDNGKQQG